MLLVKGPGGEEPQKLYLPPHRKSILFFTSIVSRLQHQRKKSLYVRNFFAETVFFADFALRNYYSTAGNCECKSSLQVNIRIVQHNRQNIQEKT